mgnify:CR=1 FL=1
MANNSVNVDTVYQKVLALANKEQRGYITPQEFNLFASQAQLEIFENYFHDLKTAQLKPKNHTESGDEINLLNERISLHKVTGTNSTRSDSDGLHSLDNSTYILTDVYTAAGISIEEVEANQLRQMNLNPLLKPTTGRPVFVRVSSNKIEISGIDATCKIDFIKKPTNPNWGYVVISGKALYNSNTSVDFDLHESEENNLVMRILELSGITLADPNLVQLAMRDQANTKAEKNN